MPPALFSLWTIIVPYCIPLHFSLQTLRPQLSAHITLHTIHQPGTRSHMTPMLTYMSLSWETPRSRVECPALSVSTIFIDMGVTSTVASWQHGVVDVLQSRWWHPLTLTGAHLIAAPFVSLPYSSRSSYSHSSTLSPSLCIPLSPSSHWGFVHQLHTFSLLTRDATISTIGAFHTPYYPSAGD